MRVKGNHSEYERAFLNHLREKGVPNLPTLEVKKAFDENGEPLKNFDNLILSNGLFPVDVKGKNFGFKSAPKNKYENWTLEEDPHALIRWKNLFKLNGGNVTPLLVYLFKINFPGDEDCFEDIIVSEKNKYGVMAITPDEYLKHSKVRSNKPKTINMSRRVFKEVAKPLSDYIPALEN